MKKTRVLALAALALGVAACASSATGRPIPREHVNNIARGVTTTAQVHDLFGDPDTRSVAADGSESWGYSFNSETQGGSVARALCPAVVFVRYLFLPLGGLCAPVRTEQELNLTFDTKQVVATFNYANRQVNLATDRWRPLQRGIPPTAPVPVIYGGQRVASETD